MTHSVVPLADIVDLEPVAVDLHRYITTSGNEDLQLEFPGTVRRYSGSLEEAFKNISEAQAACVVGEREQFVAYAGLTAVGMCIVATVDEVPSDIDPSRPNFSGFIFNQWRGLGLGHLSLQRALQSVDENFGGKAWTTVRVSNVISQHNIQKGGFRRIGAVKLLTDPHYAYLYDQQPV